MGLDEKHPLYADLLDDWNQMRDTHAGERCVKERGFRYLSPTSGMVQDGISGTTSPGYMAYAAYRSRARFPGLVRDAVETTLGVLHNKPPVIELPAKLEPMLEMATLRRESLPALLRRINEEQLIMGRCGLMLDVLPGRGSQIPYIALYCAEHIINWDEGEADATRPDTLNLVVLDESEDERDGGFGWCSVRKHRVLVLGDFAENETVGVYRQGLFRETSEYNDEALEEPSIAGRTMDAIPFVFCNTKDIVPEPDGPPLLDLSNLALAIYRGEADYRQSLFMQGQATFVIIGGAKQDEVRLGAGAVVHVPQGGSAGFAGAPAAGLSEQREALVNDYRRGEQRSTGLIEAVSSAAESGEALKVRVAARTASLNQVAMTGAYALEQVLRKAAIWVGANPDEVRVTPNLDFVADTLKGQELVQLMTAKGLGAPLSLQTLHEIAQARGLTGLTWDEEQDRLVIEAQGGLPGAVMPGEDDSGSRASDGPVDDEDEGMDDEEVA